MYSKDYIRVKKIKLTSSSVKLDLSQIKNLCRDVESHCKMKFLSIEII